MGALPRIHPEHPTAAVTLRDHHHGRGHVTRSCRFRGTALDPAASHLHPTIKVFRGTGTGQNPLQSDPVNQRSVAESFRTGLARCRWSLLPVDVFAQQCERGTASRCGER